MRVSSLAVLATVVLGLPLAGCGAPADEDLDDIEDVDELIDGLADSDTFNHGGVTHHTQYVRLKDGATKIRDLDGVPIGAVAHNQPIDGHCSAAHPCVAIQGMEAIDSPEGKTYYLWSKGTDNRSGHIRASELAHAPDIDPAARAGNGKACTVITGKNGGMKSYWVRPRPIEGTLRYAGKTTGDLFNFRWYGTRMRSRSMPSVT